MEKLSTQIKKSKNHRFVFDPNKINKNITNEKNILTTKITVKKNQDKPNIMVQKLSDIDISTIEIQNKNDIRIMNNIRIDNDLINRMDKIVMNIKHIPEQFALQIIPFIIDFNNLSNFCEFQINNYLKIPNIDSLLENITVHNVFDENDNISGVQNDFVEKNIKKEGKTKSSNLVMDKYMGVPKLGIRRTPVSYNNDTTKIKY